MGHQVMKNHQNLAQSMYFEKNLEHLESGDRKIRQVVTIKKYCYIHVVLAHNNIICYNNSFDPTAKNVSSRPLLL